MLGILICVQWVLKIGAVLPHLEQDKELCTPLKPSTFLLAYTQLFEILIFVFWILIRYHCLLFFLSLFMYTYIFIIFRSIFFRSIDFWWASLPHFKAPSVCLHSEGIWSWVIFILPSFSEASISSYTDSEEWGKKSHWWLSSAFCF